MKSNTSVETDFVLIKIVVKFVAMCRWLQILFWTLCFLSSIDTIAIQGKYKSAGSITPKITFKRLENPSFSLPKLDSSYKYLELNPIKSLTFVEEVLSEQSKQIKYNKSIHGHCYYITGLININLKSYEEAANYISKSRTYFDKSSQENYLVNKPLAYIYELLKENGMALEHYKKFANRSISRKDTLGLIYANSGMARVFQRQRRFKKARKLNIDNLKLQKENNDKKGYAFTSNSLGQISTQENKPEEAIEHFNRAKSNTRLNSTEYLKYNYELRNIYKNDYGVEELVEFQKKEVLNSLNAKDTVGILIEGNELSNIYVQNEKWDEAIKSINDNITIAEEVNDLEKLSEGYKTLSKVYTKTGEKDKALKTFEKYSKTVDSLNIQKVGSSPVSSTYIKQLLIQGDVNKVKDFLGRNYSMNGIVVKGEQRGREIGFPTTNLETDWQFFPKPGVYASYVEIDNKKHESITNIGFRPTFGNFNLQIESHIFNFNQQVYGKNITIEFLTRIRDEKKFETVEKLIENIKMDVIFAENYFKDLNI